jgi:dTDP-4-amino-4,6-dideoxygalactose transaminase
VFSFSRKALSLSEGGAVLTDQYDLFERVLAWGHTERFHRGEVRSPDLLRYANISLGGVTSRMNAMSAALGHVQLGRLTERMAEIDAAMTLFCDLLNELECITPIRTPRDSGSTMGTWYTPHALYDPALNHGLTLETFKKALVAEGFDTWTWAGFSHPLHMHPIFRDCYRGAGAHAEPSPGSDRHNEHLPAAETIKSFALPAFKRCDEITIRAHADAVAKVVEATPQLLASG